jgi:protein gp37
MKWRGIDPDKVTRSKTRFNLPIQKHQDGSWVIPDGSFVFVCSWSDFFHPNAIEWAATAWEIMAQRRGLTFLLLTKRPDKLLAGLSQASDVVYIGSPPPKRLCFIRDRKQLDHVWLGVTAENQARADERIPKLLDIDWPGKKWVSVEPMLGPVDLMKARDDFFFDNYLRDYIEDKGKREWADLPLLDWIICGGESGPGARPMDVEWARSLRDQCKAAGVPFWMKQLGGHPDRRDGLDDLPEDLRIRERPEGVTR